MKRRLIIAASLFVLIYRLVLRRKTFLFTSASRDSCRVPGIDGLHHRSDLTAGNEHQQRNPASLTKLMTGYVVDRAIDSHRITPDDIVTVGRDAWAKDNPVFVGSSLMF